MSDFIPSVKIAKDHQVDWANGLDNPRGLNPSARECQLVAQRERLIAVLVEADKLLTKPGPNSCENVHAIIGGALTELNRVTGYKPHTTQKKGAFYANPSQAGGTNPNSRG
jgi:hypothetical protein